MINFILVNDSSFLLSLVEEKITKVLFTTTLNYKIYKFSDYNEAFFKIVFTNLENKVYILNTKTKSGNGIDIARRIRNIDKLTEFIFLDLSYDPEYITSFLTSSVKAMAFINKNNLNILDEKLKEIIANYYANKVIKINTISSYNVIKLGDILYIEIKNRKTIIHTINSIIKTSKSLKYFETKLKKECDFFIKSHRASLVNVLNVLSFDFKNKKITFCNNKKCNLLSKSYKNEIKNKINNLYK